MHIPLSDDGEAEVDHVQGFVYDEELSNSEDESDEDYTHDMEQLQVALEFQCSMEENLPDLEEDYNSVDGAAACDQSDDRTVD